MRRKLRLLAAVGWALVFALAAAQGPAAAHGSGEEGANAPQDLHQDHHMAGGMMHQDLEAVQEMHRGHAHSHDFEARERLSPEERTRVMALMHEIGIAVPPMDPARGRMVFVEKGCIACHSVHGVGGDLGPPLDATEMPRPMNAFEFAARMWRGAGAMTMLQEDMLGGAISLDGQDLADLVAFAHDEAEQAKLTEDQIPERFRSMIEE